MHDFLKFGLKFLDVFNLRNGSDIFKSFKGKKENIVGHSIIDIYLYTSDTEFMTCLW